MTRAAKITYFTALIIGLAISGFFGFRNTMKALKDEYSTRQMLAPDVLRGFSYMQYRHADPEHAKAALLTYARFLEQMDERIPQKSNKRELVTTYARLSLVGEAENNTEQSRVYMTRARYWNAASGGRDFSDSEMKAVLKTFDGMEERLQW
jgi:hypothetical protein